MGVVGDQQRDGLTVRQLPGVNEAPQRRTGPDGHCKLELDPGRYFVTARHGRLGVSEGQLVELTTGNRSAAIELQLPAVLGEAQITLTTRGQRSVSAATVYLLRWSPVLNDTTWEAEGRTKTGGLTLKGLSPGKKLILVDGLVTPGAPWGQP